MKSYCIHLSLLALFAQTIHASELRLSSPRFGAAAATVGDTVYVCGGQNDDEMLGVIDAINLSEGTVQTMPFEVLPRCFFAADTWQNQLVLVGGIPYSSGENIELVNVETGSVSIPTRLPRPRQLPATAIVENRLFVVGGGLSTGRRCGDVDIYHFDTDEWTAGPDMPTPRECAVVVLGPHLYAIGGYNGIQAVTTVERLNLETMTWETMPPLPYPQSAHRAIADGDTVYLFGDYKVLNRVLSGNPETGKWRLLDMPYQKARHTAAAKRGNDIVIAGGNTSHQNTLDTIQFFKADTLRLAPTLPFAEPSETAITTKTAVQIAYDAANKIGSITNIAIRGVQTLHYTWKGITHSSTSDYALVMAPPNKLYLELENTRIWCDGTHVVLWDGKSGEVHRQAAPTNHFDLYYRILGRARKALPRGHDMLFSPNIAGFLAHELNQLDAQLEADATYLGEAVHTIAADITNQENAPIPSGVRLSISQSSGVCLSEESIPSTPRKDQQDDCQTMIETINEHLTYRYETRSVAVNEPIDLSLFIAPSDDAPVWDTLPVRASIHPLTYAEIGEQTAVLKRQRSDKTIITVPATQVWETRTCMQSDFRTMPYRLISRIPSTHLTALTENDVVIMKSDDGSVVHRIPIPEKIKTAKSFRETLVLAGKTPEEDVIIIALRSQPDYPTPFPELTRIIAFDHQGNLTWEKVDDRNNAYEGMWTLPLGNSRANMLAIAYRKSIDFYDHNQQLLGLIKRENFDGLEFDDRDRDGWIDITVLGDTVRRYEWNQPTEEE